MVQELEGKRQSASPNLLQQPILGFLELTFDELVGQEAIANYAV